MSRPSWLAISTGSTTSPSARLVREVLQLTADPGGDHGAAVGLQRVAVRRAPRHHTLGSGEGDTKFWHGGHCCSLKDFGDWFEPRCYRCSQREISGVLAPARAVTQ